MKFAALLAVSAASMIAVPAFAQDNRDPSQDFDGPYISMGGGASLQGSDRGETLISRQFQELLVDGVENLVSLLAGGGRERE